LAYDLQVTVMSRKMGFIWDIDGVVLDSPHEESWRLTLVREPWSTEGLSSDFYFHNVASRPRQEGAHAILELLGVYERLGARSEEERRKLRDRYAREKDALLKDLIARGQFTVFSDAVALLLRASGAGILQAAASASKNARTMLSSVTRSRVRRQIGGDFGAMSEGDTLYSLFDFDACGVDVGGKVEILSYAARGLEGLGHGDLESFLVFEDAASGLRAARSLGYHAVGVLRLGNREALEEAGADVVTDDLATLEIDDLLGLV
jgi:beta-phosphoglucomutase